MVNNLTVTNQYRITIQYILNRQISATTASLTTFQFPANNSGLSLSIVQQLNNTFYNCNSSTTINGVYNSLVRLVTSGTSYKPSPIVYMDSNGNYPFVENVNLTMVCSNNTSS